MVWWECLKKSLNFTRCVPSLELIYNLVFFCIFSWNWGMQKNTIFWKSITLWKYELDQKCFKTRMILEFSKITLKNSWNFAVMKVWEPGTDIFGVQLSGYFNTMPVQLEQKKLKSIFLWGLSYSAKIFRTYDKFNVRRCFAKICQEIYYISRNLIYCITKFSF